MPLIALVEQISSWADAVQFQALSSQAALVAALAVGLAGGLSLSGSI